MTQQEINSTSMLRIGTILRGTYRIDSYLSSGGFGNTYIATNIEFDERYAVKEFFMKGVTQRDDNQITVSVSNSENTNSFLEQREKFKKEARRLRQFNNQHIIRVHDMFDENGTSYYVMDYVDGENLSDRLKRTGCPMTESEVNLIYPQILDALKTVHDAGMWHLDLKPANIMLGKDGKVKIIDFGASKQLNVQKGGATTSTAISYTNGYAPREQMEQNYDKFGPWTDLYALGATLYNLLSNRRPPLPTDIDDDMTDDKHLALPLPEDVSAGMKNLILWMMQTNRMRRPQSIDELMHKLSSLWSDSSKPQNGVKDNEETIVASPKFDMTEETVVERSSPKSDKNNVETNETVEKVNIDDIDSTGNEGFAKIIICLIGAVAIIFIIWLVFFAHQGNIEIRTEPQISPVDEIEDNQQICNTIPKITKITSATNIYSKELTYIDLGLPSGTLWADRNVGAKTPIQYGGLYRWGNPNTDINGNNTNISTKYNIIGTNDDVAMKKMGVNWRTPSSEQLMELIKYCKIEYLKIEGRNIAKFIGPNDNFIVFPFTGIMYNYGRSQAEEFGIYYSGEFKQDGGGVISLNIDNLKAVITDYHDGTWGCSVRGVYKYKANDFDI